MRYSAWLMRINRGRTRSCFSACPRPGCGADNGFTLIEILVAFSLLSVLLAALYSTFFVSQKAVSAVDDSLVRLQEARAAMDMIRKELESAFFSAEGEDSVFKLSDRDFYGKQASRLIFTSFAGRMPGLASIEYHVEERNGRMSLNKKTFSAFGKASDAKDFEVLGDVGSFTIEARYNNIWVRTWDSAVTASIPDEIRVSVSIPAKRHGDGSDDQASPELIRLSDSVSPKAGRPI